MMIRAPLLVVALFTLSASSAAAAEGASKRVPLGFVSMEVAAVVPHEDGNTLLLVDEGQERILPIAIGNSEALAIHLRLKQERFARPLTHDLLDQMVKQLGGEVIHVQIDRLKEGVFHGRVFLKTRHGTISVDARPSDACALAVGNEVPIYVSALVVAEAALRTDELTAPSSSTVGTSSGTLEL